MQLDKYFTDSERFTERALFHKAYTRQLYKKHSSVHEKGKYGRISILNRSRANVNARSVRIL